jgi:hypothetical protein
MTEKTIRTQFDQVTEVADAAREVQMSRIYDDKVLREAIRNFIDAGRIATSAEMRLVCHGLASLAFSINELQKRLQFAEEKVGASPMRDIQQLLGGKEKDSNDQIVEGHFGRTNWR